MQIKALKTLQNNIFINLCWKSTMAYAIFGLEEHFLHIAAVFYHNGVMH